MRVLVQNITCQVIIGGKDNLLGVNLMKELREYLRIRPAGYSYSKAYKKKRWDGWVSLITKDGYFATGFLPLVLGYVRELGAEVTITDARRNLPKLQSNFANVVGEIDGVVWTLRDYQIPLVKSVGNYIDDIYFPRGIIDAATNAGKNAVMAGIYNNFVDVKALLIVSKIEQFKTAKGFFGQLYDIGEVRTGKCEIKDFTIAMAKTLHNRIEESMDILAKVNKCQLILVDETHEAGAADYSKLLQKIQGGVRIFVSGTPLDNDNKKNNMVIVGLSGVPLAKVTNKQLVEAKVSLKPTVHIFLNPDRPLCSGYDDEYDQIVKFSEGRANIMLEEMAQRKGQSILISFIEIAHGEYLYDYFRNSSTFDQTIELVHGEDKERDEKIQRFANGETKVLLTSTILKTSVNIPIINTLILAQGGKSVITVKQFIGRLLRDDGINETVDVIDFYDQGKHVGRHSRKRLAIYKREEFDVIEYFEKKYNKPIILKDVIDE